jgi:hypothetical protein
LDHAGALEAIHDVFGVVVEVAGEGWSVIGQRGPGEEDAACIQAAAE